MHAILFKCCTASFIFVILFSSTVLWIGQKPEGSEQGPHGVLLDRLRQSQRETWGGRKSLVHCHYLRSVTGHAASGIKWLVKGESWCDCLTMVVMKKKPKKIPVKVEKKQKIMDLSQNVEKLKPPKRYTNMGDSNNLWKSRITGSWVNLRNLFTACTASYLSNKSKLSQRMIK